MQLLWSGYWHLSIIYGYGASIIRDEYFLTLKRGVKEEAERLFSAISIKGTFRDKNISVRKGTQNVDQLQS